MTIRENVLLGSLTTLRVGGVARYVIECVSKEEVRDACAFAHKNSLPWIVLGTGSNVLAQDAGYEGVVIAMRIPGIEIRETGDVVALTVGAGVSWDALVDDAATRGLWGLENLAGIPGTVGAAPVQNIGAYGSEVADAIIEVCVLDTTTNEVRSFPNKDCAFGYRESRFKQDKSLIILSVVFGLTTQGSPSLGYKDLAAYEAQEGRLTTPEAIGQAVRSIRAKKFPDLTKYGTAGSFFKNPTITEAKYLLLKERFEGLPGFPNAEGVKIPIAYILDHVLNLRGYTKGNVSIYKHHALVLVSRDGATANEIDMVANEIAQKVFDVSGIEIEREVRNFSA